MAAAWDDMQAWAQHITPEDGRARSSTAIGRHNLNMVGDMPIAHGGGRGCRRHAGAEAYHTFFREGSGLGQPPP